MAIDAAFVSGSRTYAFSGDRYIRITRGETGPGTVDQNYPKPISVWGWPNGFGAGGIDAAFQSGSKAYFFAGDRYVRVTRGDTGPGTVDENYPKPISVWGWPGGFGANGIDAAVQSGSTAYFFAGTRYVRVKRGESGRGSVDDGYPNGLGAWNWPDRFCAQGIDAAVVSGSKTYFFAGDSYLRVTRGETGPGTVDSGYPKSLDVWGWPGGFGVPGGFSPFEHGFDFVNDFDELPAMQDLPASIETVLGRDIDTRYGLCGGMALAAKDFFMHGRGIPDDTEAPQSGPLFDYLWARQVASFGSDYEYLLKFLQFYSPTTNTRKKSVHELHSVIGEHDAGRPAVLGLVYHRAGSGQLWDNHQVLALRHTRRRGATVLDIYDPNHPNCRLQVVAHIKTRRSLFGRNVQWVDAVQLYHRDRRQEVIGLIHMDVAAREPPTGL
jgi:hypothetical protein